MRGEIVFPFGAVTHISCTIAREWQSLSQDLSEIDRKALSSSSGEIQYFDQVFPALKKYLNGKRIGSITLHCETGRVHQKPIVEFERNKRCELGDYFVVVKYVDNTRPLGRKLVIYQVKRESGDYTWRINLTQMRLLRDWPRFTFGKDNEGRQQWFHLQPRTRELGSYWLARLNQHGPLSLVGSAISISHNVQGDLFSLPTSDLLLSGPTAIFCQLVWGFGEYVRPNSRLEDFLKALYRYVKLDDDPPDEFEGFSDGEGSFWGIEITVSNESSEPAYR